MKQAIMTEDLELNLPNENGIILLKKNDKFDVLAETQFEFSGQVQIGYILHQENSMPFVVIESIVKAGLVSIFDPATIK